MDKRISKSSGKLLAAAVASVGFAGLTTQHADASLLVDLRATSVNQVTVGSTAAISGDQKTVTVSPGDTITFNVVMRVTGTNGVVLTGNFDNTNPATDTRNDDSIQALVGAFNSVGALKVNFSPDNQGLGNTGGAWSASGASQGANQDFDSDGDLDLGATGTDPTNMWAVRSGSVAVIPTVAKRTPTNPQTRFGVTVSGSTGASAAFAAGEDIGGGNSGITDTRILDSNTAEALVGELSMIVGTNPANIGTTLVNFVPRANGEAGSLWFEDGSTTGRNSTNGSFNLGAPVNVQNIVPEPATLGLLGIASLGLLARRRKQD
jgi:hypothetical protein